MPWAAARVAHVKTQGEIEAGICDGMSRLQQEHMGRGPRDICAPLIGDLLVIRLQGVLTAPEQQLARSHRAEKGRDLLKQVRTQAGAEAPNATMRTSRGPPTNRGSASTTS